MKTLVEITTTFEGRNIKIKQVSDIDYYKVENKPYHQNWKTDTGKQFLTWDGAIDIAFAEYVLSKIRTT